MSLTVVTALCHAQGARTQSVSVLSQLCVYLEPLLPYFES